MGDIGQKAESLSIVLSKSVYHPAEDNPLKALVDRDAYLSQLAYALGPDVNDPFRCPPASLFAEPSLLVLIFEILVLIGKDEFQVSPLKVKVVSLHGVYFFYNLKYIRLELCRE